MIEALRAIGIGNNRAARSHSYKEKVEERRFYLFRDGTLVPPPRGFAALLSLTLPLPSSIVVPLLNHFYPL